MPLVSFQKNYELKFCHESSFCLSFMTLVLADMGLVKKLRDVTMTHLV